LIQSWVPAIVILMLIREVLMPDSTAPSFAGLMSAERSSSLRS
jgi:hypothetical protein